MGVFALLAERGFDVSKLAVGNCSKFSACSVDRNLNLATGDDCRGIATTMVPSTFLIDDRGRVTRKLVGFKDRETLDEALSTHAQS